MGCPADTRMIRTNRMQNEQVMKSPRVTGKAGAVTTGTEMAMTNTRIDAESTGTVRDVDMFLGTYGIGMVVGVAPGTESGITEIDATGKTQIITVETSTGICQAGTDVTLGMMSMGSTEVEMTDMRRNESSATEIGVRGETTIGVAGIAEGLWMATVADQGTQGMSVDEPSFVQYFFAVANVA